MKFLLAVDEQRRLNDERKRLLATEVARLARLFIENGAESVWAFGSAARGDAWRFSDLDLIVVTNYRGSRQKKAAELAAIGEAKVPLDLIVRTPEEAEEAQEHPIANSIWAHAIKVLGREEMTV
ncbi:MAG: nucleotidyltransferase domain-containing protein [Thermaerobacter sp.]|nr:nucleotidyltransferase domain-containing protein [Thermaerobacter sp.]